MRGASGQPGCGIGDAGGAEPRFRARPSDRAADPRIKTHWIDIPSPQGNGTIRAYVARPVAAKDKALSVILVAHENRGLNPHIEDIARRLAVAGYMAVAPDALTTLGGYPGDEDKAREAFGKLDRTKVGEDFVAAARYALTMKGSNGKLGATGFCFGGGIVNQLATREPAVAGGRALLRLRGAAGRRAVHQGGTAAAVRRQRHPHQCGLAAL